MKVRIKQHDLVLAANRTQGAISDRSLAQIGIKVAGNSLKISSMDRVLAVYCNLFCEQQTEGTVFVPGKLFLEVVKQLPEGFATFDRVDNFLVITAGSNNEFTMKLPIIDGVEWKEPVEILSSNAAEIEAYKLRYMIDQTQFCLEHDASRKYGSVGYLHKTENGKLRLVATDGYRLSLCDIEGNWGENFLPEGICLSKRTLIELQRMVSEGFEKVSLHVSEDKTTIMAKTGDYSIFSRLSTVKYPNYLNVLPTASLRPVVLAKAYLQNAVKRVLIAADKRKAIQLKFADSSLVLSSKTAGVSEGKEALLIRDFHGVDQELFVNGRFLTEIFSAVSTEDIMLQFKTNDDPIVIVPQGEPSGCRSMHVLVPITESK